MIYVRVTVPQRILLGMMRIFYHRWIALVRLGDRHISNTLVGLFPLCFVRCQHFLFLSSFESPFYTYETERHCPLFVWALLSALDLVFAILPRCSTPDSWPLDHWTSIVNSSLNDILMPQPLPEHAKKTTGRFSSHTSCLCTPPES